LIKTQKERENDLRIANEDIENIAFAIFEKKRELVELEKTLASIVERESYLEQRESFIKSRYDKIGLKYN
jgi:hypothetical protein